MVVTGLNLNTTDVIKTFQTDVNTSKLFNTLLALESKILEDCGNATGEYTAVSNSDTTRYYNKYNLFQYTKTQEMWDALEAIHTAFQLIKPKKGIYVFQCWLNIFKKGGYIHWHTHRPESYKARFFENYHGFMCVNVKGTSTHYRFTDGSPKQSIKGNEGMIVLGKSNQDQHCTDPWPHEDEPRVTIAFDFHKVENCSHEIYPQELGSSYESRRFMPVVVI